MSRGIEERAVEDAPSGADPTNRTVLVVEDDRVIATLVKHLLERRGYPVDVVPDGRAAVERLASDPPGLVVLDVMLPFVDGFELIERIRGTASWRAVPIVMLTVRSQERYVVRALEAGANDYVIKPFKPGELAARIRRLLP
jgi:DNA-binding response OmpR family regulator